MSTRYRFTANPARVPFNPAAPRYTKQPCTLVLTGRRATIVQFNDGQQMQVYRDELTEIGPDICKDCGKTLGFGDVALHLKQCEDCKDGIPMLKRDCKCGHCGDWLKPKQICYRDPDDQTAVLCHDCSLDCQHHYRHL